MIISNAFIYSQLISIISFKSESKWEMNLLKVGIPLNIMKYCIQEIGDDISDIISNSIEFRIFPKQLKLTILRPIYKKVDISSFGSQRPISMLHPTIKNF